MRPFVPLLLVRNPIKPFASFDILTISFYFISKLGICGRGIECTPYACNPLGSFNRYCGISSGIATAQPRPLARQFASGAAAVDHQNAFAAPAAPSPAVVPRPALAQGREQVSVAPISAPNPAPVSVAASSPISARDQAAAPVPDRAPEHIPAPVPKSIPVAPPSSSRPNTREVASHARAPAPASAPFSTRISAPVASSPDIIATESTREAPGPVLAPAPVSASVPATKASPSIQSEEKPQGGIRGWFSRRFGKGKEDKNKEEAVSKISKNPDFVRPPAPYQLAPPARSEAPADPVRSEAPVDPDHAEQLDVQRQKKELWKEAQVQAPRPANPPSSSKKSGDERAQEPAAAASSKAQVV